MEGSHQKKNGDTMWGGKKFGGKERVDGAKESDWNSYSDLEVIGVGKINDEEIQKGCANERKDKIQFRFDLGERGEGNRKDEV